MEPPTMETSATATARRPLSQDAQALELFIIFVVNQLLKNVTLGIYHFWGRTRVRRYVWTHHAFEGERFEYTGTGRELFVGFLKVIGVLIGVFLALGIVAAILESTLVGAAGLPETPFFFVTMIATFALVLGIFELAKYNSRKYLLSRTLWRGIRFGRSGSGIEFARKALGYWALTVLTLGLYTPFRRHHLRDYAINNTWFGSARFSYDGQGSDLFRNFLLAWLLFVPTLGISWIWYLAAEFRYVARRTRLQELSFRLDFTGGQLFGLLFTNMLILIFTLGLAYPYVLLRTIRFGAERLQVAGAIDYDRIEQTIELAPATGEGLIELFGTSPI